MSIDAASEPVTTGSRTRPMGIPRSVSWRRAKDRTIKALSVLAAVGGLLLLGWILLTVTVRGIGVLSFHFLVGKTQPAMWGTGQAMGNAILGTVILTGLSAAIGVPIGVLAGVYLAEFGRHSRFAGAIRFLCNVLMGIPSIIVGIFVWGLLVTKFTWFPVTLGFSLWAGAIALAIIMIPLVARTTEDMLNLVPNSLRESALAVGAPRWRVTLGIVFKAARSGLLTGVLLGVARVSGETAPLLFTALYSMNWFRDPGQPIAYLTYFIYKWGQAPYADQQQAAWGAALLLTVGVLGVNIFARLLFRKRET